MTRCPLSSFAVSVVITLALAIGATTAVFTLMQAQRLRSSFAVR